MIRRPVDLGDPDRLYTVTGGRHRADDTSFDLVTLIVSECEPAPGMQSEHVRILELCRRPTALVEVSAVLALPVTVVRILLGDLLATGRITARHPQVPAAHSALPDSVLLKQVLDGLHKI
ncbi:DUF742 domain-containing protein [Streptomyces sp. TRM 70351]|uniref:DUF742 domain-containing protein n=1 Tax=Streptomyces sp. TRM 70351 TaxID=3116552 RepID=UPI002E7B7E9B|nr:DUF742 domain-containing protein [Streptomyces sp. TRM 70351]MEE1928945.1 DUF742 domain-containing protein [Streptomyces sp. TRM 70351]